jgi:hypothetical protein
LNATAATISFRENNFASQVNNDLQDKITIEKNVIVTVARRFRLRILEQHHGMFRPHSRWRDLRDVPENRCCGAPDRSGD